MSIFNDKTLKGIAEVAAKIMAQESSHGTDPKTEKEKQLAALAHPKDKVTHKDVLVGRGVLKKEDVEQIDEISKSTLGSYIKKASHDVAAKGAATRQFVNDARQAEKEHNYTERRKKNAMADKVFKKSWKRREGMAKAVDRLTKEEAEQLGEGWDDMIKAAKERSGPQPSGGSGIKQGSRYGGGRQKDEPEAEKQEPAKKKKMGSTSDLMSDEEFKRKHGMSRKNYERMKSGVKIGESFTEILEAYNEHGLKAIASLSEEPDNETFTKELEDQKASMAGKKKQPSVAAPSTQGVKQMPEEVEVFDADEINGTQVETIDERTLSEPEMKKREDYVKGMKKKLSGFKERYGERAKEVMYATATKMAKGEK